MEPNDLEHTADVLKSICQSQERLYTYLQLHNRYSPKQIAEDLDRTRSALQFYLDDWKQHDLIYTDGNDYLFTEKGEKIHRDLHSLHEYIESRDNPETDKDLHIGQEITLTVTEVFGNRAHLQPENPEHEIDSYFILNYPTTNVKPYEEGEKLEVRIVDFNDTGSVEVKVVEGGQIDAIEKAEGLEKKE